MGRAFVVNFFCLSVLLSAVVHGDEAIAVWSTLRIGAGGVISGMDIQCDQGIGRCNGNGTVTRVARTDTYGAYWFNPSTTNCGNAAASGCWQQIVTVNSMSGQTSAPGAEPRSLLSTHSPMMTDAGLGFAQGVYELVIAPSNTAHFYMIFNGFVYSSVNRGATWTRCSLAQDTSASPNDAFRSFNKKIAVDPAKENSIIVTTPNAGVSYSANGCDGPWTTIPSSTIAVAKSGVGYEVAFDPATTGANGTPGVYVSSYGNGVYHNKNYPTGGWSLTNGSPTTHQNMVADGAGNLWLVDGSAAGGGCGALSKYDGTGWSTVLSNKNCIAAVAVNPAARSHIDALTYSGAMFISNDAGNSFSASTRNGNVVANDIPWLQGQETLIGNYLSTANYAAFDPSGSNNLYVGAGLGIWLTNPPTNATTVTWTSQSAAVEQLVGNWIVSPPGGAPIFAVWDQGIFRGNSAGYPSAKLGSSRNGLAMAWGVDWASSSPSTIVGLITWLGDVDTSGYSSDGGATWHVCPTGPVVAGVGIRGGSIAASSPTNFVAVGTDNGGNDNKLVYTDDACATWKPASFTPVLGEVPPSAGETGWGQNYYYGKQIIVADRVKIGTYYAYNYGPSGARAVAGFWKSTDDGRHFSLVLPNAKYGTANTQMRSVPGQAGNFYIVNGVEGLGSPTYAHPANDQMLECIDRGPLTCTPVPNVKEAWSIGFGAPKPGNSYPAIYIVGWVNLGSGYKYGIWESDDHHSTWKKIGDFPNGSFDQIRVIEGDNNVYGRAYVGFAGSGFAQHK
jgi:hypothetical protein